MGRLKKSTVVLFVMVLIALYVIIEVVPTMVDTLKGTEIIEYGNLRVSNTVTAYVIRNENIYTAAQDMNVKYNVEEGTLVKQGSLILNEEPADVPKEEAAEGAEPEAPAYQEMLDRSVEVVVPDQNGVSQRKGVVSYSIDGYETYLSPANMLKLDKEKVEGLDIQREDIKTEQAVTGQPLYKITSNNVWYLTFWVERGKISEYEVGNWVSVVLGDETISATVSNVVDCKDSWQIVLRTNRYYSNFAKDRVTEAEIVTTDVNGVLISNHCITTKDGQAGVYRKGTSGEYTFVPVLILATDGKVSAVREGYYYDEEGQMVNTVEVYDEVLTKPRTETKEEDGEKDAK